ncbi:MAG TPA: AraC family transcriptional regulator [Capsulimonadaceae bacterium]
MADSHTTRSLPLSSKPTMIVAQVGVHGDKPIARYDQEKGLWSLHLYFYTAELRIGSERHAIRPGTLALAPPECTLEYHLAGRSEHLYCLFNASPGATATPVPAMNYLGTRAAQVEAEFREMIAVGATNLLRAEVKLWDLLLFAAEREVAGAAMSSVHPAVQRALRLIEQHLGDTIALDWLADEAGLSHSHLIRLFRAHLGRPPVQYIANRRMEIAENLLRHTDIPVKDIAQQVGVPDLHLFNKTFRKASNLSPRAYRDLNGYASRV